MFVAWRDLRFARGRFALMGVVIILITMLVVMLSGLTAGLGRQNTSAVLGLPADQLAFAAPVDGDSVSFADSVVGQRTWQEWSRVPGVERAEPVLVATTRAESEGRTAAVSVFGVDQGSSLVPTQAQGPGPGEAVLSAGAADALVVGTGDEIQVAGQQLVVVAVTEDASHAHTPVLWANIEDAQTLAGPVLPSGDAGEPVANTVPRATVVALTTDGSVDVGAVDDSLGTLTVSRTASVTAIGSFAEENGSLQLMRVFLFAISALVIGAFFTVWTIQRSADVAVLKALGASTRYLLRDALGQAVAVLLAGTAVGAGIAAAIGAAVRGAVPFVLDPLTVALPAVVMVALGTAGAAVAIRQITSVDPLTALGSAR